MVIVSRYILVVNIVSVSIIVIFGTFSTRLKRKTIVLVIPFVINLHEVNYFLFSMVYMLENMRILRVVAVPMKQKQYYDANFLGHYMKHDKILAKHK